MPEGGASLEQQGYSVSGAGSLSLAAIRSGEYRVTGPIFACLQGEYRVTAALSAVRHGEYAVTSPLYAERSAEFTVGRDLFSLHHGEYALLTPMQAQITGEYEVGPPKIPNPDTSYLHPEYSGPPAPALSPWYEAWARDNASFSSNIKVFGTRIKPDGTSENFGTKDLGCIPDTATVTMRESSPSEWSVSLTDTTGEYHPRNEASEWYGILSEESIGGTATPNTLERLYNLPPIARVIYNNSPKITMSLSTSWGGKSSIFSGLATGYTSREEMINNAFALTWKGTDFSLLLNVDGQTMPDVKNRMSKDVLAEILNAYSVPFDFSYYPDNFRIPFMSRQNGRPLDWIAQILSVSVADWFFQDGRVFIPYLVYAGFDDRASAANAQSLVWIEPATRFDYDLSKVACRERVMNSSQFRVINDVTAIMAIQGGTAAGERIVVKDFKEYTVQFSERLRAVQWRVINAQGGQFSDFIFRNGDGEVTAVRDPRPDTIDPFTGALLQGASPVGGAYAEWKLVSGGIMDARSVTFTWGNLPGFPSTIQGGFGEIVFFGTTWDDQRYGVDPFIAGNYADPFPGLRARSRNLTSVAMHGIRPIELQPNSLIPDRVWLQRHADRYLKRLSMSPDSVQMRVAYNPEMRPGVIYREIDARLSRNAVMVTAEAVHSIDPKDPDNRYTMLTGRRLRPFVLQHIGAGGQVVASFSPILA